jgi:hypothetical protein
MVGASAIMVNAFRDPGVDLHTTPVWRYLGVEDLKKLDARSQKNARAVEGRR